MSMACSGKKVEKSKVCSDWSFIICNSETWKENYLCIEKWKIESELNPSITILLNHPGLCSFLDCSDELSLMPIPPRQWGLFFLSSALVQMRCHFIIVKVQQIHLGISFFFSYPVSWYFGFPVFLCRIRITEMRQLLQNSWVKISWFLLNGSHL